ncbi:MAG: response regulator [bacterium]
MQIPRALFVDDEPYILKALLRAFMDEEIEISTAQDGDEALEFLRDNPVDLILTDHNMPNMTGVELLRQSIEIQPDAIRMLITGKGDLEVALQAINQGNIYKFFHKPWDDEDLRISIQRALEYKRARARMKQQEEELARYEAYRQTMITISHYINNFNCALTMSLDNLKHQSSLSTVEVDLVKTSLRAANKISEVLKIMNRLDEIKVVEDEFSFGMIDIETEMQEAAKRIETMTL